MDNMREILEDTLTEQPKFDDEELAPGADLGPMDPDEPDTEGPTEEDSPFDPDKDEEDEDEESPEKAEPTVGELEYLGNAGSDKHFYLRREDDGSYVVLDADEQTVYKTDEEEVPSAQEFILQAASELGIASLAYEVVEKYFFSPEDVATEQEEQFDEDDESVGAGGDETAPAIEPGQDLPAFGSSVTPEGKQVRTVGRGLVDRVVRLGEMTVEALDSEDPAGELAQIWEDSPTGFEDVVKALKRKRGKGKVDNPWAIAWSMQKKGYKPSNEAIQADSLVESVCPLFEAEDEDSGTKAVKALKSVLRKILKASTPEDIDKAREKLLKVAIENDVPEAKINLLQSALTDQSIKIDTGKMEPEPEPEGTGEPESDEKAGAGQMFTKDELETPEDAGDEDEEEGNDKKKQDEEDEEMFSFESLAEKYLSEWRSFKDLDSLVSAYRGSRDPVESDDPFNRDWIKHTSGGQVAVQDEDSGMWHYYAYSDRTQRYEEVGSTQQYQDGLEEAITPEERAQYTALSKKMKQVLKAKYPEITWRVQTGLSKRPNPYIRASSRNWETEPVPNELRTLVLKTVMPGADPRSGWDDVEYGNVMSTGIALRASEWEKVLSALEGGSEEQKAEPTVEGLSRKYLDDIKRGDTVQISGGTRGAGKTGKVIRIDNKTGEYVVDVGEYESLRVHPRSLSIVDESVTPESLERKYLGITEAVEAGRTYKVDMKKVREHENLKPYLDLVRMTVKGGEGRVYVSSVEGDYAQVRAWENDVMGDVRVPVDALKESITEQIGSDMDPADKLQVLARSISDEQVAQRIAREKGGRVIQDESDERQYMVVVDESVTEEKDRTEPYTPEELEDLWRQFGDVAVSEEETIESDFLHYPAGTSKYEVWGWFDRFYPNGVHALMFRSGNKMESREWHRVTEADQLPESLRAVWEMAAELGSPLYVKSDMLAEGAEGAAEMLLPGVDVANEDVFQQAVALMKKYLGEDTRATAGSLKQGSREALLFSIPEWRADGAHHTVDYLWRKHLGHPTTADYEQTA